MIFSSYRVRTLSLLAVTSMILYLFYDVYLTGNNSKLHRNKNGEQLTVIRTEKDFLSCRSDYILFDACKDSKKASDPSRSTLALEGGPVFKLGDEIKLSAHISDGYNKSKFFGGDHLRARMWSTDKNAFSSGIVWDNYDGTYTVIFKALWTGLIYLEVELLYPREIISAVYRTRNEKGTGLCQYAPSKSSMFRKMSCIFKKRKSGQINYLDTERSACNFTIEEQKGSLRYCYRQNASRNSCEDWKTNARSCWTLQHPLSDCEKQLANRKQFVIGGNLNVTVISSDKQKRIVDIPSVPCTRYNTKELWFRNEPTGFFYEGIWLLRHCQGGKTNFGKCLQNKTILFQGDSTLHHWRKFIFKNLTLSCVILEKGSTPIFNYQDWHNTEKCYSKEYNFTFIWVPPNGYPSENIFESYYKKLICKLDTVETRNKLIVVVTVFLHGTLFEFGLFKTHMVAIRQQFEDILKKFSSAKLFVRLPHTHRPFELDLLQTDTMIASSDYVGNIFHCIINDVFKGMYDKIIVLDNRDATIAIQNKPSHPGTTVIAGMVKQLMNYICYIPDDTQLKSS